MNELTFALYAFLGSFGACWIGSLAGIGGGTLIVPLLVVLLKVDFHYAVATALLATIAASTASAVSFLKEGFANIRIGTFLGIATALGAIGGAISSLFISTTLLYFLFTLMLIYSLWPRKSTLSTAKHDTHFVDAFKLSGSYTSSNGQTITYKAQNILTGWIIMLLAGILSGLLGIGSGALKILALDHFMKLPFKVSTTTSNFMVGVTAAASAGIYFKWGFVDPVLTCPVILGALLGSLFGSRLIHRVPTKILRIALKVIILFSAFEMLLTGIERWQGS